MLLKEWRQSSMNAEVGKAFADGLVHVEKLIDDTEIWGTLFHEQ